MREFRRWFILFFISWRLFLFLPLFAGWHFLEFRQNYDYASIWKFVKPYYPVSHPLLFPWANFDGVHYLSIASEGYNHTEGYFPVYPFLIRLVAKIFGGGQPFSAAYFFSGLLLANLFFVAAMLVFYKLLRLDYATVFVKKVVLFLLFFPTAFYFVSVYTESLFLLLVLSSLYFARKGQWLRACLLGMLVTATRIVGVAIIPALFYEIVKAGKIKRPEVLYLLLTPIGIGLYAIYNYFYVGSWLAFAHFHSQPGTSKVFLVLLPQTMIRYLRLFITFPASRYEWWIAFLEFSVMIFVMVFLYVAWKKKVRLSYLLFAGFSLFFPLNSGTFSGLPRYSAVAFPIFLGLALVKNRLLEKLYIIVGITLLFILLLFFSRGYFVA